MPVESIDIRKDIPRATRKRKSALRDSEEFQYVQTKLAHGLKPHEGLRVILKKDTLKRVKNAPRLFKLLVQKYVDSMKLDYDVFTRGTTQEGTPIIFIVGRDARIS